MPILMSYAKKNSVNYSGNLEFRRRSSDKCPLEVISRKVFGLSNSALTGIRTFTSPMSPSQSNDKNLFKLDKLDK